MSFEDVRALLVAGLARVDDAMIANRAAADMGEVLIALNSALHNIAIQANHSQESERKCVDASNSFAAAIGTEGEPSQMVALTILAGKDAADGRLKMVSAVRAIERAITVIREAPELYDHGHKKLKLAHEMAEQLLARLNNGSK